MRNTADNTQVFHTAEKRNCQNISFPWTTWVLCYKYSTS